MKIAIASGKGGTGKTTVATNLAASMAGPVQLLDCDVEEPNAHIFLPIENEKRVVVGTMVPEVDNERCSLCGACSEICEFSAIMKLGDTVLTFPEMCHSCRGCVMVCPEDAIGESSRELGELVSGRAGNVDLVYGRLRVGEAMSPPLIEAVKERAAQKGVIIIDAPPGTSCPVMTALRGVDFVVLVTEPTPFGFNDLVLAVEAVRTLGIPFGLVINRCDSGDSQVRAYADAERIPVLLEIPERRDIAEHYSRGVMMIHGVADMGSAFERLYAAIADRIGAAVKT
jgi:MinD superfamily P-loop ATPase